MNGRNIDLLDRLHDLRDAIGLLELAAASLSQKHERNAIECGITMSQDILDEILAVLDGEPQPANEPGETA